MVESAFESVLDHVERAKEELSRAVPSPRGVVRRPLAEALLRFEEELRAAEDLMAAWRRPRIETVWSACAAALRDSLEQADRLRLEAPAFDYEGLVATLGNLIAPLDVFEDAEGSLAGST